LRTYATKIDRKRSRQSTSSTASVACKIISNQTEEITTFFDPAGGYVQAIGARVPVNEALAYFSNSAKKSAIISLPVHEIPEQNAPRASPTNPNCKYSS
jgi:hypothetical protein